MKMLCTAHSTWKEGGKKDVKENFCNANKNNRNTRRKKIMKNCGCWIDFVVQVLFACLPAADSIRLCILQYHMRAL